MPSKSREIQVDLARFGKLSKRGNGDPYAIGVEKKGRWEKGDVDCGPHMAVEERKGKREGQNDRWAPLLAREKGSGAGAGGAGCAGRMRARRKWAEPRFRPKKVLEFKLI